MNIVIIGILAIISILCISFLIAGCAIGKDYKRKIEKCTV